MAQISLDDEIQKDKQKQRMNRAKNKLLQNKFNSRPRYQQQDRNRRGFNDNREFEEKRNFKSKFINKRYRDDRNERPHYQNDERRRQEKVEKKEEEGRQFRTLKVMGLSPQITNEDLYKLFASEGSLEKCLIEQDNFGRTLTTAIVKYHSPESAKSAISNFNRHKVMNCVLTVEPYKNVKNDTSV